MTCPWRLTLKCRKVSLIRQSLLSMRLRPKKKIPRLIFGLIFPLRWVPRNPIWKSLKYKYKAKQQYSISRIVYFCILIWLHSVYIQRAALSICFSNHHTYSFDESCLVILGSIYILHVGSDRKTGVLHTSQHESGAACWLWCPCYRRCCLVALRKPSMCKVTLNVPSSGAHAVGLSLYYLLLSCGFVQFYGYECRTEWSYKAGVSKCREPGRPGH